MFDHTFLLEIDSMSLYPLAKMRHKRAAHSLVHIDGDLVVVGGLGQDCEILRSCERYSVDRDEWLALPDLNIPAMNPSVCVFSQEYLFKFGGKRSEDELANTIERLHLGGDSWELIHLDTRSIPRLPSSSCCFQVNRSTMIFLGGTFDSYSKKSRDIWVCSVLGPRVEVALLEDKLPVAEGFWMQQPISLGNSGK